MAKKQIKEKAIEEALWESARPVLAVQRLCTDDTKDVYDSKTYR